MVAKVGMAILSIAGRIVGIVLAAWLGARSKESESFAVPRYRNERTAFNKGCVAAYASGTDCGT